MAYSLNGGYQNTINGGERREKNLRGATKFVQVSDEDERARKNSLTARNAKQIHSFFSVFILE